MTRCWIVGALAIFACSEATPHAVVVATAAASPAECPLGGAIVSSGTDDNGNGVLDDEEAERRTVVCNEAPVAPPPTLVRLVVEPVGAHCAIAGTAVQSGPDRDGNGKLDDDEVAHTAYACGEALLTRMAAAQPDERCVAGGLAFLAGRDRNHDGRLADDEVEQREVACGEVLARDIAIRDAADVAALARISVMTGALTVEGTALRELALPRLVQAASIAIAGNPALARVSLPALQSIDGRLALVDGAALSEIDLPALHRVGGLVVDGNPALRDLRGLAAITEVTGDVQISRDDALTSIDLAIARMGGALTIDRNRGLTRVAWSMPGTIGAFRVTANEQLDSVELAGTAAERLARVGSIAIAGNHALTRVALDADDLGAIAILDSPRLADIAVTGVEVAGDVSVTGNGELRLSFTGLAPAFTIGGDLRVSGPVAALTTTRPIVVRDDCTIDRTLLTSFGPDQVSSVGRMLVISNNQRLTEISSLRVGDWVEIRGNHAMTELGLTLGEQFFGQLTIANNASLEAAPFEGLRRILGYVQINDNPALKLFAPSLEEVTGNLLLFDNEGMTELRMPRLRHVGGLEVEGCDGLLEIEMPALSRVSIFFVRIVVNLELRHLEFPLLRFADMIVLGNPRLPACEVRAMFARMGGQHDQRFNDETAVCP